MESSIRFMIDHNYNICSQIERVRKCKDNEEFKNALIEYRKFLDETIKAVDAAIINLVCN